MKTLITDDFAERPDNNSTFNISFGAMPNTTGTMTGSVASVIVTTGGYVPGDPPPPEVYRTQAWVEKPKAIEQ